MNNSTLKSLLIEYDKKRINAENIAQKEKENLYEEFPELDEIDKKLSSLAFSSMIELTKNNDKKIIENLNSNIEALKKKKENILNSIGERAKKIINATKGSRVVQNDYLFKGLLRCYDCKGYIGIRSPDKNGNIYGRCQRYGRFGKFDVCSPHNFNYQVFEEQMLEVLKEVCKEYTNKKKLEEIAKQTKTRQAKEFDINKQIELFRQTIEKETRKLEVMYDDRLAGIISLDEYMKNAKRIKEIVKGYEENIRDLEKELAGENTKNKETKLDNLIEEFLQMEKPTKEIIREFIEKIEIHSDKQVDIYFNFKPLQDLNNNFICAKKEYERKVG